MNIYLTKFINNSLFKSIIYFLIGTLYASIIFTVSIYQMENISLIVKIMILSILISLTSITMSLVSVFRCIMALVIFNFVTSSGKVIITTYIIRNIINGPLNNTFENVAQLARSIQCQYDMYKQLNQISKSKLNSKKNFIILFQKNFEQIQAYQSDISRLMKGLRNELDVSNNHFYENHVYENFLDTNLDYDFKESVNITRNLSTKINNVDKQELYYQKKINQCLETFETGNKNCQFSSNRLVKHCQHGSFFFRIACPKYDEFNMAKECSLKNTNFRRSPENICHDFIKKSDYNKLDENLNNLIVINDKFDQNFNSTFDHKINLNSNNIVSKDKLKKIKTDLNDLRLKFKSISELIEFFINIVKLVANLSYSFVFINSYKYHFKYLNDISFDNSCISKSFEQIDTKRMKQNKRTLLPIKKYEQELVHFPFQLYVSEYQKPLIKINILINILIFLIVLTTLLVDYILYDFLLIIKDHLILDSSFKFNKKNKKNFNITGDGFVADILRSYANEINQEEDEYSFDQNYKKCIPIISIFKFDQIRELVNQVLLLILLIMVEFYLKRFNKNICGFYYRKWEKKRAIWLYNDMLKKRKIYFENSKKKIILKHKNGLIKVGKDFFLIKLLKKVRMTQFLNLIGLIKKLCVICETKQIESSVECSSCSILYCSNCWLELKQKCLICSPNFNDVHSWEHDYDFD